MTGKNGIRARLLGMLSLVALAAPAGAVTVPFVEDFAVDAANWRDNATNPLTWNASGGPDGGSYVSVTLGSLSGNGTIQFRANDSLNASGDAFVGNWIGSVSVISAQVIHDAPQPINFFFRFAGAGAMVGLTPAVAPNTWTTISVAIDPGSLTPAGGTFAGVMGNVLNLQVGTSVPVGLANQPFTYGLDDVTLVPVPEPATAGFLAGGLALLGWAGRRRALRQSCPSGGAPKTGSRASGPSAVRPMTAAWGRSKPSTPLRRSPSWRDPQWCRRACSGWPRASATCRRCCSAARSAAPRCSAMAS